MIPKSFFSSGVVAATIFIISCCVFSSSFCRAFRISALSPTNQPPRSLMAATRGSSSSPSSLRMTSETEDSAAVDRRAALGSFAGVTVALFGAAATVQRPPLAFALDMDAFANQELASDQAKCNPKTDPKCIPKLTSDEALCKYGQSGDARGEACRRVKQAGGSLPNAGKPKEKSLGGAYAM